MSTHTTTPPVRKTVTVRQPVDEAFSLFTASIDQWWPKEESATGDLANVPGTVVLEQRPGGRVYRRDDHGGIEFWGEVLAWDPPHRILLAWQPASGTPAATEIEVCFTPEGDGTRVDLEHRGWDELGGQGVTARAEYDTSWGDVLRQYSSTGGDNGAAIAALVLGIASVLLPAVGLLAAPFAIGFGIAGRRRARGGVARHAGLATAGLTLGAIGLVLWGVLAISLMAVRSGVVEQQPVPVQTGQVR